MQINKHVHALRIPFTITTPAGAIVDRFVYVYLIYGTNGVYLIDSGVASSEQAIFGYLWATGRKVSDISLIIQTHSHPDHIGASRTIKAETGCEVAVHPSEKAWIENVQLQARERPVPGFGELVAGSLAVPDVRYLLSSWDEPRQGAAVYARMDAGLQYFQRIHDAVRACSRKSVEPDPLETARCVLKEISLPPALANPIVAGSIAAHLGLRDKKNIIRCD